MKKKKRTDIIVVITALALGFCLFVGVIFVRICGFPRFTLGYEEGHFQYLASMTYNGNIKLGIKSHKRTFPIDDVTVKLHYGVYSTDGSRYATSPKDYYVRENEEDVLFGIYVVKNDSPESVCEGFVFEDYKEVENHIFLKDASSEEVFEGEYWHDTNYFGVSYNHNEEITIPAEIFTKEIGTFHIKIIPFTTNSSDDEYTSKVPNSMVAHYRKIDDDTIKLISEIEYMAFTAIPNKPFTEIYIEN